MLFWADNPAVVIRDTMPLLTADSLSLERQAVTIFLIGKEFGVTLRRSAPGVQAPEVSLPAALVKARALKARANLKPSNGAT